MPDKRRWIRTHCARMDHGGCAVWVETDGRRIFRIKGDPDGYLNKGFICRKGRYSAQRLTHPERLRTPLVREGARGEGNWRPVAWDEALDRVCNGLDRVRKQHGAKGVAFCQGMPKGIEHFLLIRLANTFGSPNVVAVQDVCHAPRELAGVYTCGFYPVADFAHDSALVMAWGSNPPHTNEEGLVGSRLVRQLGRGTRLIVVDPVRTDLAKRADLFLQVAPGQDAALALSFLHVVIEENLFDREFTERFVSGLETFSGHVKPFSPEAMESRTRVPAAQVREAARMYAAARPAAIAWGNPIEQTPLAFDTARSLVCLMALAGNLDVPGGNIRPNEPPVQKLGKFVRADLLPDKRKEMISTRFGTLPRMMTIPPTHFRRAVLSDDPYPVRAAYVQCANPMLTWAESGLTEKAFMRLEFLAVSDIFLTPTARLADVVLPAATHYEFNDLGHLGLGHGILLARPKIIDPPDHCRPDARILCELGRRLTSPDLWPEEHERLMDELLAPAGLDYTAFVEKGFLTGKERFRKYEGNGFRTKDGKVALCLDPPPAPGISALPDPGPAPVADPAFPLLLTTAKDRNYLHSAYRWVPALAKRSPFPTVRIHPETAGESGIRDGAAVAVETRHGRIVQRAELTSDVLPGVVLAAYGWETCLLPGGRPVSADYNRLTRAENLGIAFGTPKLKGIACRISPAAEGPDRGQDQSSEER